MAKGVRLVTPKGKSPWSVYGLKEAQASINTLIKDFEGKETGSGIRQSVWDVMRDAASSAARLLAAQARRVLPGSSHESNGKSGTARVVESIFASSRRTSKHPDPSGLFGVRKRGKYKPYAPAYVEWMSRKTHTLAGMSIATMAEKGKGTWKAPRPILTPIWGTLKAQLILKLVNGYRQIVNHYR